MSAPSVLLYGPSGTGKTESVMQIAKETGRAIYHVDISSTKSCWFGESEKLIKEVFKKYEDLCEHSEKRPILLFNEADGIFSKRKNSDSSNVAQTENTIQNIILEEMERLEGILIATTNMADNLDGAFERRFLFKIKFEKPVLEARKSIWTSKMPTLTEDAAQELAAAFSFSGGEIDNVVRKATIKEVLDGEETDALRDGFLDGRGGFGIQANDVCGGFLKTVELSRADGGSFVQKDDAADLWSGTIGLDAGSSAGSGHLGLNLVLDLGKGDGTEVVVVHAHVVLERKEHPQARVVQAGVAGGTAMNVAEELPDVPIGAAVAEEGVVVEDDSLASHADGHLLGDEFELAHIALPEAFHIMIAEDEVLAAGEGAEDVVPEARTAVSEVPQMEDDAVLRDGLPPAANQFGIHLLRVLERTVAITYDVLVAEMGVGSEPDVFGVEFIDLFGHSVLFCAKLGRWNADSKSLQGLQEFGNEGIMCNRKVLEKSKSLQTLQRFAGVFRAGYLCMKWKTYEDSICIGSAPGV